jgi:trans-aconitate methyltransferase
MPEAKMWEWKPYTISNSRYERLLHRLFSKLFSERESVRALDYGCGHGYRAKRIVQYLTPTVGLFLFDVDYDLLQKAIERTGGQRWIPGKDRFDLILCFAVLELLPRPARAKVLELFADCMNDGAILAIQQFELAPTRGTNNLLVVPVPVPPEHIFLWPSLRSAQ